MTLDPLDIDDRSDGDDASTSLYRCAECGHGEHLTAYAEAVAFGPLGPNGKLARHDDVDDDIVFETSIACTVHLDATIEKLVDGGYGRWLDCLDCNGSGKRGYHMSCHTCFGGGAVWRLPVAEATDA
jgi:hypothetical protein